MLTVGDRGWHRALKDLTAPLGPGFWANFRPATAAQLSALETSIGRALPPEFVEFYRTVGYGYFDCGGGFDSPEYIADEVGSVIWYVLGSMYPSEWASREQQQDLWRSRGQKNPDPSRFTTEALILDGVPLYDLLGVASDGCCGYAYIYVGPLPGPTGYCFLYSGAMESREASFSAGLIDLMGFYLDY